MPVQSQDTSWLPSTYVVIVFVFNDMWDTVVSYVYVDCWPLVLIFITAISTIGTTFYNIIVTVMTITGSKFDNITVSCPSSCCLLRKCCSYLYPSRLNTLTSSHTMAKKKLTNVFGLSRIFFIIWTLMTVLYINTNIRPYAMANTIISHTFQNSCNSYKYVFLLLTMGFTNVQNSIKMSNSHVCTSYMYFQQYFNLIRKNCKMLWKNN